jgi:L-ascorbate metabolism protein UlaG (beta-lactamase superfamily)
VDPFFDNPHTSLEPADVDAPDYLLLTHAHADHIAHAGEFPDATVVATPELTEYVTEETGLSETLPAGGMNLGGTVECGDAFVTMHRADHTNGAMTGYEYDVGMPAGFVVSDSKPTQESDPEATTFYHAGDTGLMTEMREVIGPYLEPDAAALPIGDQFTMGPVQAAVAVDWLDVDHAFPMHYDTFPPIEIDTDDFVREVRATGSDAEVQVLDGDESFTLE